MLASIKRIWLAYTGRGEPNEIHITCVATMPPSRAMALCIPLPVGPRALANSLSRASEVLHKWLDEVEDQARKSENAVHTPDAHGH